MHITQDTIFVKPQPHGITIRSLLLVSLWWVSGNVLILDWLLLDLTYLDIAYSLRPSCRFIAVNVPIQPRRRFSFPIFHVTNSGLKQKGKTERERWTISTVHVHMQYYTVVEPFLTRPIAHKTDIVDRLNSSRDKLPTRTTAKRVIKQRNTLENLRVSPCPNIGVQQYMGWWNWQQACVGCGFSEPILGRPLLASWAVHVPYCSMENRGSLSGKLHLHVPFTHAFMQFLDMNKMEIFCTKHKY